MVAVTTAGLRDSTQPASALQQIQWAAAAGTVDAITATYPVANTALLDGLILGLRAAGRNTSTTPTFSPDSLAAETITKVGGKALAPGDIPRAGYEALLRYNATQTRWELLNPDPFQQIQWAIAGGTADALTATFPDTITALTDGLLVQVRAGADNATITPTFAPDGLTAHTITKNGGLGLVSGDIKSGGEYLLRYNLAGTRWELMNHTPMGDESFYILASDDTGGSNANTAQPLFPTTGGVTLKGLTTYEFEIRALISRAAGSTSHTTSVLFGGSATLTSIAGFVDVMTGDANSLATTSGVWLTAATATQIKSASTSTTEQIAFTIRGVVRINGGGTFIPQFQYSAAPGGAPTIKANSYARFRPLGSNTVVTKGTWA